MKKHDLTDEEILQRIKSHVDDTAQQALYDPPIRNLSVNVLQAQQQRRRGILVRRTAVALGTIGAATVLYLMPLQQPDLATADPGAAASEAATTASWSAAEEADAYMESLVEAESVDLLSEAADADPLLLSDRDVDQLFEGL